MIYINSHSIVVYLSKVGRYFPAYKSQTLINY